MVRAEPPPATHAAATKLAAPIAEVERLAQQHGLIFRGTAAARPSDYAQAVRDWLLAGSHGEMAYLARRIEERLDPAALLPGAASIISVADRYHHRMPASPAGATDHSPTASQSARPAGRIARYAWGRDYHKVLKQRLAALARGLEDRFPGHRFAAATDTGAILEREHAARAGLGWIGKNTMLIHPQFGSWFLLGQIITTLPLPSSQQQDHPGHTIAPADHCGTCTRCIDACPTACITPRRIDARRCISYLTLEHRSEIPQDLHAAMGDWIAGCDICQEVCPYNDPQRLDQFAADAPPVHPDYAPGPAAPALDLLSVLGWTEQDRQAGFRGSALKRMKYDMIKRNAIIAAGNAIDAARAGADASRTDHAAAALLERLKAIASSPAEPPLVRSTAHQVLTRLHAAALAQAAPGQHNDNDAAHVP